MPRPFSLLIVLLIGAALALTIPFLASANLPSNALKRFFSRAKPRLEEVTQPGKSSIITNNMTTTNNMTKTPVYFISHGMPSNHNHSNLNF
jgi:hypothetical protein